MKLMIAYRTRDCLDLERASDYVQNPEWINAPHELVQLNTWGNQNPTVGPYRFLAKDIAQAEKLALEQDWDGLKKLSVPELIPPTK